MDFASNSTPSIMHVDNPDGSLVRKKGTTDRGFGVYIGVELDGELEVVAHFHATPVPRHAAAKLPRGLNEPPARRLDGPAPALCLSASRSVQDETS